MGFGLTKKEKAAKRALKLFEAGKSPKGESKEVKLRFKAFQRDEKLIEQAEGAKRKRKKKSAVSGIMDDFDFGF